ATRRWYGREGRLGEVRNRCGNARVEISPERRHRWDDAVPGQIADRILGQLRPDLQRGIAAFYREASPARTEKLAGLRAARTRWLPVRFPVRARHVRTRRGRRAVETELEANLCRPRIAGLEMKVIRNLDDTDIERF